MVTYFNKKDLVEFGEYLLSDERKKMLRNPGAEKRVSHADIENFLYHKSNKSHPVTVFVNGQDLQNCQNVKILEIKKDNCF